MAVRVLKKLIRQGLDQLDDVACNWLYISKFLKMFDMFKGFKTENDLVHYYQHGYLKDNRLPIAGEDHYIYHAIEIIICPSCFVSAMCLLVCMHYFTEKRQMIQMDVVQFP